MKKDEARIIIRGSEWHANSFPAEEAGNSLIAVQSYTNKMYAYLELGKNKSQRMTKEQKKACAVRVSISEGCWDAFFSTALIAYQGKLLGLPSNFLIGSLVRTVKQWLPDNNVPARKYSDNSTHKEATSGSTFIENNYNFNGPITSTEAEILTRTYSAVRKIADVAKSSLVDEIEINDNSDVSVILDAYNQENIKLETYIEREHNRITGHLVMLDARRKFGKIKLSNNTFLGLEFIDDNFRQYRSFLDEEVNLEVMVNISSIQMES